MIIHLHWHESNVTLRVKQTTTFSAIAIQYFRNQGFRSGDFFYRGSLLDRNMTVAELGLINYADIYVKNVMFADISNNNLLEVKVHISDSRGYRYMCTKGYSVRAGTTCKSLVDSLRSELCETRPLYILNGPNIVSARDNVSGMSELLAIVEA